MTLTATYRQPNGVIGFTALLAAVLSFLLLWKNNAAVPVNFVDGDSEYYYYYLQSTFIDSNLYDYEWLHPGSGSFITHHPVGVSLVLLPFFLVGYVAAKLFAFPVDGLSLPFQVAIAAAALFYCVLGLVYLKKLFRLNNIPDTITALTVALLFFGTTLYHYTLIEGAMSHVYSFCFITLFLYHSCKFVKNEQNSNLICAALAFGMILIIRANNVFILFSLLFWFRNKEQAVSFFKRLLRNKAFYYSIALVAGCVLFQLLTWAVKEQNLFTNRYAPYGFYWLHPQLLKMLFGFDNGFFIYTPLCLLFLFGLGAVYKENKFFFYTVVVFLTGLLYFFSAYSAYTYFDGLGIRVLVDYYAVFALLGAKLLTQLAATKLAYGVVLGLGLFFVIVNVIYSYQGSHHILLRSGMTFNQWKYIFLKTGKAYENSLGGSNELTPYAKQHPEASLQTKFYLEQPFDFAQRDFGPSLTFDSINFNSNRILLKINCARKEAFANASKDALVCVTLQDRKTQESKSYFQFRLNETPATECCEEKEYQYSSVMAADFKTGDKLSVYLWNVNKQPFRVSEFSVDVYNYNYQIK